MIIDSLKMEMAHKGIDVFGTSDCTSYVPQHLKRLQYAITIGVRLSDTVVDGIKDRPTKMYFHHYRTVNAMLDQCALYCVIELQRVGYNAVAIPASQTTNSAGIAGDFQHKTAANLAGLGFMGKSGLFISKDFGPRVRYATILTDLELPSGEMVLPQCNECRLCVNACPCGAIVGNNWTSDMTRDDVIDAALCSRHMKDKYQMIGRGSVCGICMAVCPFGSKRHKSKKTY